MIDDDAPPPGDRARASVLVRVPQADAFRVFTDEIDAWWRRSKRFRIGGSGGRMRFEPHLGGSLYESFETRAGDTKTIQTGTVTVWEPPDRLAFEWRAVNFVPTESTLVEVEFEPRPSGTLVTVTHSGWSGIRPDHPVRHGAETAAFVRTMGMWWGDLLGSLRRHASGSA